MRTHKIFNKVFCLLSIGLMLTLYTVANAAEKTTDGAYDGHPRIVILVVIDQFRGDLLARYRDDLKAPNGFNLFLKRGAYFTDCYYKYANTKTAPGHTTIGTGAYTDGHGIASNEWWDLDRATDHPVSSVEDPRYRLVGTFDDLPVLPPPALPPTAPRIGASPRNELASTFGDEVRLATSGRSKLYGISLKDRAAILPAGATANAAYWIDQSTGRFLTSTYYMSQLPDWVTAFNKGPRAAQAMKEADAEGTTQFYDLVGRTAAANSYELDFAEDLIQNEKLGQNGMTDVLTVSLSANDILGHQMGPDSDSQKQMTISLDKQLNDFFSWLDTHVPGGLASTWVVLTADHGISPIPYQAANVGVPAANLDLNALADEINKKLSERYTPGNDTVWMMPLLELPYLSIDRRPFEKLHISEAEAEKAVADLLPAAIATLNGPPEPVEPVVLPGATPPEIKFSETRLKPQPHPVFIRTKTQLLAGDIPATEFGQLVAHSVTSNGGWYVMLELQAYQMEFLNGIQTTHFSPWSYDRHVPLGFFGAPFVPGLYRGVVEPVDIAATITSVLGVNRPSSAVGHVLTQMLRPETTGEQAK